MKSLKTLAFLTALSFFSACGNDDEVPEIVNEEEVITTVLITLTTQGGGTATTAQSQDLDGDGPNAPVVTVSGNLTSFTTYDGSIELLNETVNPAEDITEEVEEEDEEHQFFYSSTGSIDNIMYNDADGNGNPVGLVFLLTTREPGTGTLSVTLRHEPTKPNDGTAANAGGETDVAQTFNITVD
ncbi:MAG: type 1 periplasmic binding fold superfamily protein [Flavobacteriaceae bacterium]